MVFFHTWKDGYQEGFRFQATSRTFSQHYWNLAQCRHIPMSQLSLGSSVSNMPLDFRGHSWLTSKVWMLTAPQTGFSPRVVSEDWPLYDSIPGILIVGSPMGSAFCECCGEWDGKGIGMRSLPSRDCEEGNRLAIFDLGFGQSLLCAFPCFICITIKQSSFCHLHLQTNRPRCGRERQLVQSDTITWQGWASNSTSGCLQSVSLSTHSHSSKCLKEYLGAIRGREGTMCSCTDRRREGLI